MAIPSKKVAKTSSTVLNVMTRNLFRTTAKLFAIATRYRKNGNGGAQPTGSLRSQENNKVMLASSTPEHKHANKRPIDNTQPKKHSGSQAPHSNKNTDGYIKVTKVPV